MKFYHWFSSHPNDRDLSGDVSKLQEIGKELRVVDARQQERPKQTDFCRISSVPDIWSQHRLFEMLLLNKAEDPSYLEYEAIAKREWQAMVSLLVLGKSYGITIHMKTIRFEQAAENEYLCAAYGTRPSQDKWASMDIYYVMQGETRYPIAMSSPNVHIVPTKDAWSNLRAVYPKQIPWLTEDQVYGPVVEGNGKHEPFMLGEPEGEKTPAMMPVHALMLHRWLGIYKEDLAARQQRKGYEGVKQNLELVTAFEAALSEAYHLDAKSMPNVSSFLASGEEQKSVRIGTIRVPEDLKVFLDRVFYSVIDQSSTLPEVLDTHRFAGGIAPECLVSKRQKDGKFAHYLVAMPVSDMLWQLWRDNESMNPTYSLRYVFAADGVFFDRITASVAIGDIRFSKTYSVAQIEHSALRNLCTAGIWPRQNIEGWKDYYLFCNELNGYRLEPEGTDLAQPPKTHRNKEGLDGPLNYYKLNSAPNRCRLVRNETLLGYLCVRPRPVIPAGDATKVFRAAIDFGTSATTLYGGIDEASPQKLSSMNLWSLPLMNLVDDTGRETSRLEKFFVPPLPLPLNQFGIRLNIGEATNLDYESLLRKTDVTKEFPEALPLQTILADAAEDNGARQLFYDSWIYFRAFMFPRQEIAWPRTHSNLKWTQAGQTDQCRIKAILTEFLLMIALEARVNRCGKISLTASYPLAFEENLKKTYFRSLNEMLTVIERLAGIVVLPPPQEEHQNTSENIAPLVGGITESEAVYRYSVRQDSYNQNYFVIDIGGGSTDIFISLIDEKHRRNSFATSLGFGARKVLIDKLCSNDFLLLRKLMQTSLIKSDTVIRDTKSFLKQLESISGRSMVEDLFAFRVPRDLDNPAAAQLPESFGEAFINTCAESFVNPALEKSDPKAYQEDISFLELKKRIAFFLGASVWLSGLMVRGGDNIDMSVSLLFAGNGSKMIRWLSPDIERIRHFITSLFQRASRFSIEREQMNCRFSSRPKEEAAYGALADFPAGFVAAQTSATKQVSFGGEIDEKSELGAFRSMQYETTCIQTSAAEFETFMQEYQKVAKLSFGWNFLEREYSPTLLENSGVRSTIRRYQPDKGYFMNAVNVVAAWNMGKDQENLSY